MGRSAVTANDEPRQHDYSGIGFMGANSQGGGVRFGQRGEVVAKVGCRKNLEPIFPAYLTRYLSKCLTTRDPRM